MAWLQFAQTPTPPAPIEEHLSLDQEGDEPGDFLMSLLPWTISLLMHVGLVLLAVFVVWTVRQQIDEEEVIIPIARLSATPGAPLTMTKTKTLKKSTSSMSRRSLTARSTSQARTALASKVSQSSLSMSSSMAMASRANPFDTGVASDSQLKAKFFGTGGNAKKIAYLVDASGSLIDTLPFVIMELKRSIGELSQRQSFTVIFFQGEEAIEVPPRSWKKATSANKQRLNQWLDEGSITPMGLSNPVKAMQLALRYKPQLLFILSDNITGEGRYEVDQARLIEAVRQANRHSGTKINTFQFLYEDKLIQYGMKPTLELISEDSGGTYKFIDGRELGIN